MKQEAYVRQIVNGGLSPRNCLVELGASVYLLEQTRAYHADQDSRWFIAAGTMVRVSGMSYRLTDKGNIPLIVVQKDNADGVVYFALVSPDHLCYAECPADRVLEIYRTDLMLKLLAKHGYQDAVRVAALLQSYGINKLKEDLL
ncbi:hypothetical protein AVU25_gp90 [Pseudomonas phage DL64]|uniref:Uncharacterized protein n=1 Tax=Pseudomonas phage DL64 TaxID=1640973 RepID=A0A0F6YRJ2_9CAUD|nr:hypothetical protein AVU25_gp90 [Pseudomonas phage DL64]AKF14060.1 hypothetical protein [Pseudomonas phage DL64]